MRIRSELIDAIKPHGINTHEISMADLGTISEDSHWMGFAGGVTAFYQQQIGLKVS